MTTEATVLVPLVDDHETITYIVTVSHEYITLMNVPAMTITMCEVITVAFDVYTPVFMEL